MYRSATNAVARSLAAVARSERSVNAWVLLDREQARSDARAIDDAGDAARLPLRGITVGVKDIIDVAGMPTVAGFGPYAEHGAAVRDAAVVERLRAAGTVILGKTVTTQFAVGDPPVTRNPWNLGRTPGGSSSGSAAAVAAGHVDLAIGSQTTGSTLRPAAYCGVYAVKPSFNWTSRTGMIPLCQSLDHVGLIASTLDVLVAAFEAAVDQIGGPERPDVGSMAVPRIGVWREPLNSNVDDEIRTRFETVVESVVASGAVVEEAPALVPYEQLFAIQQVIFGCEGAAVHRALLDRYPDDYSPKVRSFVEVGSAIPAQVYVRAQTLRSELRAAATVTWSEFDALMLPTVGSTAPTPETTGDTTLQAAATLFGFPAASLPAGLAADGMPWGIQLIAPIVGATRRLVDVARWIDDLLPRLPAPPISTTQAPTEH